MTISGNIFECPRSALKIGPDKQPVLRVVQPPSPSSTPRAEIDFKHLDDGRVVELVEDSADETKTLGTQLLAPSLVLKFASSIELHDSAHTSHGSSHAHDPKCNTNTSSTALSRPNLNAGEG